MRLNSFTALFFILFLATVTLFGGHALAADPYKNGRQLYIENPELVAKESGFFIKVPVDYSDPSKGITEIYAHFQRGCPRFS